MSCRLTSIVAWFKPRPCSPEERILRATERLTKQIQQLIMTSQELTAQLDAMTAKINGYKAQIDKIAIEAQGLKDALDAAPVTQAVVDAFNRLSDAVGNEGTAIQKADDVVPDQPPAPDAPPAQ